MQKAIQNLFNFVHDNLGIDNSAIGLCRIKNNTEFVYVNIPKEFKKTYIQNVSDNYLLL